MRTFATTFRTAPTPYPPQTALCFAGHFANGWEDLLLLGAGLAAVLSGSLTASGCVVACTCLTAGAILQHLVPVLCGVWVGWPLGQVGGYIAFRAQLATISTGLGTLGREFTTLSRWVAHFLP
jgi:hypothetical protein